MKFVRTLLIAALAPLALPLPAIYAADHGSHSAHMAQLTKEQQKFLANYEGVRAGLAGDDLAAAKRFAAKFTDSPAAAQIAKAASLDAARDAFKKLSADAVQVAKGHEGYYIANCPMAEADWVQTSKAISNPYYGKSMLTCGSIKN